MTMNKGIFLISFALAVLLSCEDGFMTDCERCYTEEPESAFLEIYLSDSSVRPAFFDITIYEGAVEDSIVHLKISASSGRLEVDAMFYKDYTVVSEYDFEGYHYTMIDAACPGIRYDESTCDYPCYYIFGNVLDLRKRY